jgi:hypothetical protein
MHDTQRFADGTLGAGKSLGRVSHIDWNGTVVREPSQGLIIICALSLYRCPVDPKIDQYWEAHSRK